jgi:hypothetical protein
MEFELHSVVTELFEQGPDAAVIVANNEIIAINKKALHFFDARSEGLIGQSAQQLYVGVPPETYREYAQYAGHSSNEFIPLSFSDQHNQERLIHVCIQELKTQNNVAYEVHYFRENDEQNPERLNAEAMNWRIRKQQQAIVRIANALGQESSFNDGAKLISEAMSQALQCARVSVWMLDQHETEMVCCDLFEADLE